MEIALPRDGLLMLFLRESGKSEDSGGYLALSPIIYVRSQRVSASVGVEPLPEHNWCKWNTNPTLCKPQSIGLGQPQWAAMSSAFFFEELLSVDWVGEDGEHGQFLG